MRRRILIAEDDPLARLLLERTLRGWGYDVVVTTDGHEALAALDAADRPQLAILDWMMPGIDGIEVCRRIRTEVGRPYVFVLMLTARESREDLVEAMVSGADDFVHKPFDHVELQARLRAGHRIIELEQKLVHQAAHDALTDALNRGAIEETLGRELARSARTGAPVGVAILDLDHFKAINDRHGHPAGDAVLVEVCRRVQGALRPYDALGRWGGEEFLVVLPDCDGPSLETVAERMRDAVASAPIVTPTGAIQVTASFGVRSVVGGTIADVVRDADTALYRAKHSGRNKVFVGRPGSAAPPADVPVPHRPPILVIDDHPDDRRVARDLLTGAGHLVIDARSLTDAATLLRSIVPGLILVDIRVTGGTARDVLEIAHADPRLADVPVVVITALDIPDAEAQLARVGFDAYVPKPVSPRDFLRQVELLVAARGSPQKRAR